MLEHTQKNSLDITNWLLWFIDCLNNALDNVQSTLKNVHRKARFWENISQIKINDRQRLMLNKLVDGFHGKLNTSKWAKIANCSQDTALRDIAYLIEKNILRKDGAGGRSTSYILHDSE